MPGGAKCVRKPTHEPERARRSGSAHRRSGFTYLERLEHQVVRAAQPRNGQRGKESLPRIHTSSPFVETPNRCEVRLPVVNDRKPTILTSTSTICVDADGL